MFSLGLGRIGKFFLYAFNTMEFIVFAAVIFFGLMLGNWIVGFLGLSGSSNFIAQLASTLIPLLVVYLLWKKVGRKVA